MSILNYSKRLHIVLLNSWITHIGTNNTIDLCTLCPKSCLLFLNNIIL